MTKQTTHDLIAETLTQPYKEPSKNTPETTHDAQMSRYIDRFTTDPNVTVIADILTSTSDEERNAVRRALAGETK